MSSPAGWEQPLPFVLREAASRSKSSTSDSCHLNAVAGRAERAERAEKADKSVTATINLWMLIMKKEFHLGGPSRCYHCCSHLSRTVSSRSAELIHLLEIYLVVMMTPGAQLRICISSKINNVLNSKERGNQLTAVTLAVLDQTHPRESILKVTFWKETWDEKTFSPQLWWIMTIPS